MWSFSGVILSVGSAITVWFSASHEILHILQIPKVHCNILPSMPGSSKWPLSLRFPHLKPEYASPLPLHATCLAHHILDFVIRTIFGEQYRSLNSSLFSFLHSLGASSLLHPTVSLSTLFWSTLSLRSSLKLTSLILMIILERFKTVMTNFQFPLRLTVHLPVRLAAKSS